MEGRGHGFCVWVFVYVCVWKYDTPLRCQLSSNSNPCTKYIQFKNASLVLLRKILTPSHLHCLCSSVVVVVVVVAFAIIASSQKFNSVGFFSLLFFSFRFWSMGLPASYGSVDGSLGEWVFLERDRFQSMGMLG